MGEAEIIQDRVSSRFGELSPQLKHAAQFLLDHPIEIATHSLRHVAGKAELSPPTFSRLARALGFETYEDMREICRGEVKQHGSKFAEKVKALQALDPDIAHKTPGNYVLKQASAAISSIQELMANTDTQRLAEAADRLNSARNVLLIGAMSSRTLIEYLAYMADLALGNWHLAKPDGYSLSAAVSNLDERDAAIVVTQKPYARLSINAANLAAKRGAYVVAITDGIASPVLKSASAGFLVSTDSPQFFPSHVATLVLLESIMGMVVRRAGDAAHNRISAMEEIKGELDAQSPSY